MNIFGLSDREEFYDFEWDGTLKHALKVALILDSDCFKVPFSISRCEDTTAFAIIDETGQAFSLWQGKKVALKEKGAFKIL